MEKSSPKVIFTCKFRLGVNNPDNHFKTSGYRKVISKDIRQMTNYYKNKEKEVIGMIDYYTGSKQDNVVNLVLENGKYATLDEQEKIKKDFIKATEYSNLYKGVISFDNDWIYQNINIRDLEKTLATDIIPKFLKQCGFQDMKKMRYCFSFHGNTKHLHLHLAFAETAPNYKCKNGKIAYRRIGIINEEEKKFMKNEILMSVERQSIYKPMIIDLNKSIDELKMYFNPKDRNFILKDINEIKLEEKIIKLGFLLDRYRNDKTSKKIKYGSIKDNELGIEIKKLTSDIKNDLFKNKNSELYKQKSKVNADLKKLNDYYDYLNKANHIETKILNNKLVIEKEKYIDSYVLNAIVNHALFRTTKIRNIVKTKNTKDKITLDDLLQELAYEKSQMYKNKNVKLILLKNSFRGKNYIEKYKLNHEISKSIKNLNYEMEEYAREFRKLFVNKDYEKQNY